MKEYLMESVSAFASQYTVGSQISEHVGTEGCSVKRNVRITEHHRKQCIAGY